MERFFRRLLWGQEVAEESVGLPTYHREQHRDLLLRLDIVCSEEQLYPLQVHRHPLVVVLKHLQLTIRCHLQSGTAGNPYM